MATHKKLEPTYTCKQWTGTNFEEFKEQFEHVTNFLAQLTISEYDHKARRFNDHPVRLSEFVVVNDLNGKIEVLSEHDFTTQYVEID